MDAYDFSLILTKEGFNEILSGYLPGINLAISQKTFKAGSTGSNTDDIHSSWSEITVQYFSQRVINNNINAVLNPDKQTIDFIINNISIHSNIFNITYEYTPYSVSNKYGIKCPGIAQILINDYNMSISYYVETSKNMKEELNNNSSNGKIPIDDCQLKIKVKENSVKIHFPKNDMPLDYSFNDQACDGFFTNKYIEDMIRKYINFYFKEILPYQWGELLEKSLRKLQRDRQWLAPTYDNITTYDLICYKNNSITNNGLLLEGVFIDKNNISHHSKNISRYYNSSVPSLDHEINNVVMDTMLSGFVVMMICGLIGCISTFKYIIWKCCRKHRKQKKRDLIERQNLLIDELLISDNDEK